VADFGLSHTLSPHDTHISDMHAGTLNHMAPELLGTLLAAAPGFGCGSDWLLGFGLVRWPQAVLRAGCSGPDRLGFTNRPRRTYQSQNSGGARLQGL